MEADRLIRKEGPEISRRQRGGVPKKEKKKKKERKKEKKPPEPTANSCEDAPCKYIKRRRAQGRERSGEIRARKEG